MVLNGQIRFKSKTEKNNNKTKSYILTSTIKKSPDR